VVTRIGSDTFAVSLLLKGVSIEIVSKLLGHSSIKVTERHYAPYPHAPDLGLEQLLASWMLATIRTPMPLI
jgi:integrase